MLVWDQVFTSRKFMSKLLMGSLDMNRLSSIDSDITACLADMQASMQVSGLEIHRATYEEMKQAHADILARIDALGGQQVAGSLARCLVMPSARCMFPSRTPEFIMRGRSSPVAVCAVCVRVPSCPEMHVHAGSVAC